MPVPDSDTIKNRVLPLITNAEVGAYFLKAYERRLREAKVFDLSPVQAFFKGLQSYIDTMETSSKDASEPWSGQMPMISREALEERVMAQVVKLTDQLSAEPINMELAVNDQGQLERSYSSSDGQPVSEEIANTLDEALKLWLIQKNMTVRGGVVYEAGLDGEPKKNKKGLVKADYTTLAKAILDDSNGIGPFVAEKNKRLKVHANVADSMKSGVAPSAISGYKKP